MKTYRVENMKSSRGNDVPNQFIIRGDGKTIFQSYYSIIVIVEDSGQVYLDEKFWDYSVTTGKYRNQFLGETKKETLKKIKEGTYILKNLNS